MAKETTIHHKGSAGRAFAGILVAYVIFAIVGFLMVWAYDVSMIDKSDKVINWIASIFIALMLFLYCYGWLGHWLTEMEESRNIVIRVIGKVFGFIGYILWPFPLMAFGPNKKRVFVLGVSLPLALFGIALIIVGISGVQVFSIPTGWKGNWSGLYYVLGVAALVNALLGLLTKKCPNCGCLMGKIDYDYVSISSESYNREYSQKIGSASDSYGNTVDLYQDYSVEHAGSANTYAKTFICTRCGTKKQGRGFTVHAMSYDDPRRNM